MWGLWLSRGICGIVCADMRTLRFVCLALLLVMLLVILPAGSADQGELGAEMEAAKPPTAVDRAGNATSENRHGSGAILITMTGMVGDPGDLGQGE